MMTQLIIAGLIGAACASVPSLIGWSLSRNVRGVDRAFGRIESVLSKLTEKIEGLSAQDAKLAIEMAEIRVRLAHVEMEIASLKRVPIPDSAVRP